MNWQAMDFFVKGGIFMVPLVICSVVSLMVILDRALALRRGHVITTRLAMAVENFTRHDQFKDLSNLVARYNSHLSRLIATVLNHSNQSRIEATEATQMQARHEILLLERGLVILEIIVGIAPLLGLLGTVSGLVHIFESIGDTRLTTQGPLIARGISEALNTTVAGLVIAIPSLTFWSYYNKKIESLSAEMEAICGELLTKIYQSRD